MDQEQLFPNQFESLRQELMTQMKDAEFSEGSCRKASIILNSIQSFILSKNISTYSPEIGEIYLEEYFSDRNVSEQYKKNTYNYVNKLNDVFYGRCLIKRTSELYNESLRTLLDRLINLLQSEQYSNTTIANYTQRLRKIQAYMRRNQIIDYTPDVGKMYFEDYIHSHTMCDVAKRELKASIQRLNDVYDDRSFSCVHSYHDPHTIPECYASSVDSFFNDVNYVTTSKRTIRRRTSALSRFLNKCISCGASAVCDLTPQTVYLASFNVSDTDDWIPIRQFLRFLAEHGETASDLSLLIPKYRREKKLPSTYSIEEIQRLEDSIDTSTCKGRRDHVIILMTCRLAIRSGDIASMKLCNLDFVNEQISLFQEKTGNEICLPMIPALRDALNDYLPDLNQEDDYVFHRLIAPHTVINSSAVNGVINKYLRKAGIKTSGKKHGPHAFRASVSTSMINDGISYEVVKNVLGHKSPNCIRYYAKNDLEKLRRCAIPVPEATGKFRQFLKGGVQS